MKALMIMICMTIVSASYAVETNTDCPMMLEKNERSNPKANLNVKPKENSKRPSVSAK